METSRVQEAIAPRRVLVLYWTPTAPSGIRSAIRQHLEAIKHSPSSHRLTFWNTFDGSPALVRREKYDAVILHTTLLCLRWFDSFAAWRHKLNWVSSLDCLKIAMPQDEYNHSEVLDEWLRDLDVDHVFSNFGTDVRHLLYPHMSQRAQFQHAFTGYIDENLASKLETRLFASAQRRVDVVYRSTHPAYWFGRLGQLKYLIGEKAQAAAVARGLTADISSRTDDAIIGDEWFDFLSAGRVVVGCESGSSVLDRRGEVQASIRAYLQDHSDATFEEVAARMPQGWDSYRFAAISPRHFEAVITKTCQVLVAGRYDDVFKAGIHYLPVREDLADLGDVLLAASDPAVASRVTERTYEEIYRSGRYTYRALAEQIDRVLGTRPPNPHARSLVAPAMARYGSWRLSRPSNLDYGFSLTFLDSASEARAPAAPWIQVLQLLGKRPGGRMVFDVLGGRVGRKLLAAYLRAGKAASSIPASRLVPESSVLNRMSKAQSMQPGTPSFRAIKAVSRGSTLELSVLRRPTTDAHPVDDPGWPPRSLLVRLPSYGGLTPVAALKDARSVEQLEAVSALAALRPVLVFRALRPLLDSVGGARSRPRHRGARNRVKAFLTTTRVVLGRPGNLWLLVTAAGRAPLGDTADDLLKVSLLRTAKGSTRVARHVEPKTKTLRLVTGEVGPDELGSQIPTDVEIKRVVWDHSAVSGYVSAPVMLGRRMTVFLGAGGIHEFTAIEALPDSARKAILRQLEG